MGRGHKPIHHSLRLVRILSRTGVTPRMAEVLVMPRSAETLGQLLREKPRGACAVCWRDVRSSYRGRDPVACRRTLPDSTCCPCNRLMHDLLRRFTSSTPVVPTAGKRGPAPVLPLSG